MVKVGVVVSTQTLTWQYSHLQQLSNVIQTSLSIWWLPTYSPSCKLYDVLHKCTNQAQTHENCKAQKWKKISSRALSWRKRFKNAMYPTL